jgi:hypothetical protein
MLDNSPGSASLACICVRTCLQDMSLQHTAPNAPICGGLYIRKEKKRRGEVRLHIIGGVCVNRRIRRGDYTLAAAADGRENQTGTGRY